MKYFWVVVPLLASCGDVSRTTPTAAVRDSAGVRLVESPPTGVEAWSLGDEPDLRVGAIEGAPEELFGSVVGVAVTSDRRIVVADQQTSTLRVYDWSGTFIEEWGGQGEGPGEYGMIWGFGQHDDSLWVVEAGARRITMLSGDGEFGRVVRPQLLFRPPFGDYRPNESCCHFVGALGSGSLVFQFPAMTRLSGLGPRSARVPFVGTDGTGQVLDTLAVLTGGRSTPTPPGSRISLLEDHFSTRVTATTSSDALLVSEGRSFELREYTGGGRVTQIARYLKARTPTDSEKREAWLEILGQGLEVEGPSANPMADLILGGPFADSLPGITRILVDSDGNRWGEHWIPPVVETPTYVVFAPSGEVLAEVLGRAGFVPYQVRDGYMVGVERDDLEVQYLARYQVVRP